MMDTSAQQPLARALAALRDADRFLHVARTTHARELEEARHERRADRLRLAGSTPRAVAGEPLDDGIVAEQEFGEAVRLVEQATAVLAEDVGPRAALLAAVRDERGRAPGQRFEHRVDALHGAVRTAFEALRADAPDQGPLPVWGHSDDEDREIARAAGAGIRLPHIIVATLGIALVVYVRFFAR